MTVQSLNIRMTNSRKNGLIAVAAMEIFFGVCSIGCSIATIIYTKNYYRECYYYRNYYNYCYDCNIYLWLSKLSLSAQGIWTGCMVIISASLNIRLAKQPSKLMGNVSGGFSVLSFILTCLMLIMECFPVSEEYAINSSVRSGYYDSFIGNYRCYYIYSHKLFITWALHCALLGYASILFALTMSNMIISYQIVGCCGSQNVNPLIEYVYSIPMQNQQRRYVPYQQTANISQGGYIGSQLEGQQAMSLQQQPTRLAFFMPQHNVDTSLLNQQLGPPMNQDAPTSMMQQYNKEQVVQNVNTAASLSRIGDTTQMNQQVEPVLMQEAPNSMIQQNQRNQPKANTTSLLPPLYPNQAMAQINSSRQTGGDVEQSTSNTPAGSAYDAVN